MKLTGLYIENFGCLHRYDLEFGDGITVIQEPNGFGKTTLAEFIRAMFYGFPRAAKTLDKSKRKKYMPWSGGKCGGNLTFELDGEQYRIERTFGATPRGDSFALIDLKTNKKSDRFSENIGMELFQLDAESFERSTYMPQSHETGALTTDSIRAKLGDLVEDTNDINNFDKAVAALRAKRSTFIPYRGSGGSVAEAKTKVSHLQQELDCAEKKRESLAQTLGEITRLETQLEQDNAALAAVRARITEGAQAAASAAVRQQYEAMLAERKQAQAKLAVLGEKYLHGIPAQQELDAVRETLDRQSALECQTVTTQADLDAARFLEENRDRFAAGIPDGEELESARKKCGQYVSLTAEAQASGLTEADKRQFASLSAFFAPGVPTEKYLEELAQQHRQALRLRTVCENQSLSAEEQHQLERLEAYFTPGLPGEGEIRKCRQDLESAAQLQQENIRLAVAPAQAKEKGGKGTAAVLILGLLGVALGIVLLVCQKFIPGGIALGAGLLALAGAGYLGIKQMVSKELSGANRGISPENQARMNANEAEASRLMGDVRNFAIRYSRQQSPTEALHEIQDNLAFYQALLQKQKALAEKQNGLVRQTEEIVRQLSQALAPYYGEVEDFDRAIMDLRIKRSQFLNLTAEKAAAERKMGELSERSEALRQELTAFLKGYFDEVEPGMFHSLLSRLQRDADAYAQARTRTAQWQASKERHEKEMRAFSEAVSAFASRYGLTAAEVNRQEVQQMRDDGTVSAEQSARVERLNRQIEAFRAENKEVLERPAADTQPDLGALKEQESEISSRITDLTRNLLEQKQSKSQLRGEIDRIPEIRDALEAWQEKKDSDFKKSELLDETMDFLQRAKDSLSGNYLGTIQQSFSGYLSRMMGEEKSLVSSDLEVQLERQGQARELGYFSAGQTDMVMLCMRFALVDALFGDLKPFVILDDPFVNLDDGRTAEALKLLKELARDRQIIYLVCNSSRSL